MASQVSATNSIATVVAALYGRAAQMARA